MLRIQELLPTYFDTQQALDSAIWRKEVNFEPNQLIEIIAPSGSGKTSLIHFLYGLRKNYTGAVYLDQTNITTANLDTIAGLRKNKLSIVFQDLSLFPQLTIEENILLQHNLSPFLSIEEIKSLLDQLGVLRKWNQKASLCSYGERQRVAIVRALSKPFEYLLLDEPFSHLDENNSLLALEIIQEQVKKRKATMILADLNKNTAFNPDQIYHL